MCRNSNVSSGSSCARPWPRPQATSTATQQQQQPEWLETRHVSSCRYVFFIRFLFDYIRVFIGLLNTLKWRWEQQQLATHDHNDHSRPPQRWHSSSSSSSRCTTTTTTTTTHQQLKTLVCYFYLFRFYYTNVFFNLLNTPKWRWRQQQ